jgi:hypothetical protein
MSKKTKGGASSLMNSIMTILAIIVLAVIGYFIWYRWFSGVNNLSGSQVNLNTIVPPPPILVSTLSTPKSTRYSYSIWIYVNTWKNSTKNVIFSRYNDIVVYLDSTSAVLKCIINPQYPPSADATAITTLSNVIELSKVDTAKSPPITITSNFPIQKWVCVTFVIDNQTVDIYLDGKMVKSLAISQVNPDDKSNIYYGYGAGFDTVVSGFKRWPTPIDPQSVWNYYTSGNGSSALSNPSGYHAVINITSNNAPSSQIKLF